MAIWYLNFMELDAVKDNKAIACKYYLWAEIIGAVTIR
jgi:hypothetical protein